MARMSIDDSFLRDPRVKRLALRCGFSVWEARGRLLEVWAICYDRASPDLPESDVDDAADFAGFAAALDEVGLAALRTLRGRRVAHLAGVEKRIEYLGTREESGRQGGLKSGEARRKKKEEREKQTKVTFEATNETLKQTEAPPNPPDPVPDLVPASAPVPDPPPDPQTQNSHTPRARAIPAVVTLYNPEQPGAAWRLTEDTYKRLSEARVAVAAELGLTGVLAFPEITPSTRPQGYRDLLDRVREEGKAAPGVCDRVVEALVLQAREQRSVEWLSEKSFSAGAWRTAREYVPGAKARASPRRDVRVGRFEPMQPEDYGEGDQPL